MARFQKFQHLRKPAEFESVYRLKQKAADGELLVFAKRQARSTQPDGLLLEGSGKAATTGEGATRIGLSVSRKRGHAVIRNREKRLLREAFRHCAHELPSGLDLIVVPISKTGLTLKAAMQSLKRLTVKLDRRLPVGAPFTRASEQQAIITARKETSLE